MYTHTLLAEPPIVLYFTVGVIQIKRNCYHSECIRHACMQKSNNLLIAEEATWNSVKLCMHQWD